MAGIKKKHKTALIAKTETIHHRRWNPEKEEWAHIKDTSVTSSLHVIEDEKKKEMNGMIKNVQ